MRRFVLGLFAFWFPVVSQVSRGVGDTAIKEALIHSKSASFFKLSTIPGNSYY